MGKHFEFHFLEAPYVILDKGDDFEQVDVWTRAAILASRITALETDRSYGFEGENNDGKANRLQEEIKQAQSKLNETSEGREVSKNSNQEDIEGLVARKTGRSLSRSWVTSIEKSSDGEDVAGVQLALAQIGDYMRENGTVSKGRGRKRRMLVEQGCLNKCESSVPWRDRV